MQSLPYRKIKQSLNLCYASTALFNAFMPVAGGSIYIAMLLSMGMSDKQIGHTLALPMFTIPIQIVGAMLQQRFFNRKKFWFVGFLLHNIAFAAIFILLCLWNLIPNSLGIAFFFVCLFFAAIGIQARSSVDMAWLVDIVPDREVSVFWNRNTAIGIVSSVVIGLVFGYIADILGRGERSTFAILMAIGLIAVSGSVWLRMLVPDPTSEPNVDAQPLTSDVRAILSNPDFRRILSAFTIHAVGGWLSSAFIFVHLQRTMHFSLLQIQIFSAISCVVSWLSASLFQVIGRRHGRKPILVICLVAKAFEFILWGLMRPGDHWLDIAVRTITDSLFGDWAALPIGVASVIPVFIIGGFVNVGIMAMQSAIIGYIAPRRCNSLAIGIFSSVSGLAGGITAAFSGSLVSLISEPGFGPDGLRVALSSAGFKPFNILAICSAVSYLVSASIIRKMKETGATPAGQVVRTLFETNPFRGVYHAQILARPMKESARFDLLERVRGPLVSSAVVGDLFSCSTMVRNEALRAVIRVGAQPEPEVREALVRLLAAPELGMQVNSAFALGRLHCEEALPSLESLFDNPDTCLATAAIAAAGQIGSSKAVPGLRAVVKDSKNLFCRVWAVEALSRVGDFHQADTIFEVYNECHNSALSMQCLVSLCRCMCDVKNAYLVFDEEARVPGSRIGQFISSIHSRGGCEDTGTIMHMFDAGDYSLAATSIITHELTFCAPDSKKVQMSDDKFVTTMFADDGSLVDKRMNLDNYVSCSLRIQLRLWSRLRHTVERDPFVFLSILYFADRLWKRLDPKYQRRHPAQEDLQYAK